MRIFYSKNIKRDSYIWNMIGSFLMAFQSVIMLIILTRTVGIIESGIFTIANANANLSLNIGKYGMRNFQVSDVMKEFSFSEYKISRIITSFLMILFSIVFTSFSAYSNYYTIRKFSIILLMCVFKVVDAIEDIYLGMYQKEGRLDVASKIMSFRLILTIIFFSILIILTYDLLFSLIMAILFTSILLFIFIVATKKIVVNQSNKNTRKDMKKVFILLQQCFPLFFAAFLSFYIGNAPKYAIDAQLNDTLQACYGFISMPVFVIGLLNNFIFNPLLRDFSYLWQNHKLKKFIKNIIRQCFIIAVITIICIIGAYICGIPVLSLLYNTDLSNYKLELIILLLGGGFLGLIGFLTAIITIMRCQKVLVVCYAIIAILICFLSPVCVSQLGILGATLIYLASMIMLAIIFSFIVFLNVKRVKILNN